MSNLHRIARANSSTGAALRALLAEMPRWCSSLALVVLLFSGVQAFAQTATPPMPPASPELELRLKKLETELRCLVCQNQTLADSPAGLAGDLRREVRLLADSGKSDEEIKQHLKARYGDFVLYKPTVESKTWLLWFGPFLLLLAGAVLVIVITRRTRALPAQPATLSDQEQSRAQKLLDE